MLFALPSCQPLPLSLVLQAAGGPDSAAWTVLGIRALLLVLVFAVCLGSLWLAVALPRHADYQVDSSNVASPPAARRTVPLAATGRPALSPFTSRMRLAAGSLSIGTALVHSLVIPEHFDEWWGYGVFFVVAAFVQGLYGLALLDVIGVPTPWWRLDRVTSGSNGHSAGFYWAGIIGNSAVILLYLVTRTVGIPLFGPEAGTIEPITLLSVLSKAIEAALIVVLWRLLARLDEGR